jgi:hypothetical protein
MFQYLPLFGFPVLPALLRFLQNRASMNLLDGVLPEESQKASKAMEEGGSAFSDAQTKPIISRAQATFTLFGCLLRNSVC